MFKFEILNSIFSITNDKLGLKKTYNKISEAIIVTADDDTIYPNYWLENSYNAYLKRSNMIYRHRTHKIIFDKNKNLKIY